MSTWKDLCEARDNTETKCWLEDELIPGFFMKMTEFDKIRAVVESIAPILDWDCGDSGCFFAKDKIGMRTNGSCRCINNRSSLTLRNTKAALKDLGVGDE